MQNLPNVIFLLLALCVGAAVLLLVLAIVIDPRGTRSAFRRWRAGRRDQ